MMSKPYRFSRFKGLYFILYKPNKLTEKPECDIYVESRNLELFLGRNESINPPPLPRPSSPPVYHERRGSGVGDSSGYILYKNMQTFYKHFKNLKILQILLVTTRTLETVQYNMYIFLHKHDLCNLVNNFYIYYLS